jgi:integrase
LGTTEGDRAYRYGVKRGSKYKPFLHHISKGNLAKTKLLKVKEPKTFPGCLSDEEVKTLINACNRIRDKFLICLLYETGMRIGETLGLRHSDMVTGGKNEVHITNRLDNFNQARAKSGDRIIHVNKELMQFYSDYLIEEYPEDVDSDYVFVSIWSHQVEPGTPLKYSAVDSLFRRLSKKTGIHATAHLLRHSHATNLIRAGWDMSYVQKRLGHTDIQTTVNTYVHLLDDDLKAEYQKYLEYKNKK